MKEPYYNNQINGGTVLTKCSISVSILDSKFVKICEVVEGICLQLPYNNSPTRKPQAKESSESAADIHLSRNFEIER